MNDRLQKQEAKLWQFWCAFLIHVISFRHSLLIILVDDVSPKDPFTSYLLWPHFHFSGTFRSDVSTVNNNPLNFDTDKFTAADLIQGPRNLNPMGSGEWSVTGSVTHVCYANGHCVGEDEGDKSSEPLMRALIKGKNWTLFYTPNCRSSSNGASISINFLSQPFPE